MADPLTEQYDIRCPVCLYGMSVDRRTPVFKEIKCTRCRNPFELQNALPPEKRNPAETISEAHVLLSESGPSIHMLFWGLPLTVVPILWGAHYHQGMSGPSFLGFIGLVFLAGFFGSMLLRRLWYDTIAVRIIAFLIFEGISIHRLVWGYANGFKNFDFLWLGMIFGGFLFFLRINTINFGVSGKGGFRSSGCGGGCGSGCGGGCGGCGG